MRYRLLGNSGLRVSELCLGTMTFGDVLGWGADFDESRRMFETFLEAGGNFVDTANNYTLGTSEQFLGDLIGPHRERLVVATKATMTTVRDDPVAPHSTVQERSEGEAGLTKDGFIRHRR